MGLGGDFGIVFWLDWELEGQNGLRVLMHKPPARHHCFGSSYSEVVFLCKLLGHDDQSVKVRGFVTEKKKGLESSNVPI